MNQFSTFTTVSKMVDLLATTFSGDLMDSSTGEHDTKEKLSDLIKVGVVIKGLEKKGFRDHLLINAAGTTDWTKFVKDIENARRNTPLVQMDLSAMGSQDQKFQGNCSRCGIYGDMARDFRKKNEYLQNNQTSGWSGTDDKSKSKPGTGKGRGKQDKGKGKGKPGRGKSKNKNKRKIKHHGKKVKKGFHEMEGHAVKNTQNGRRRTRLGITLTAGLMQTGGRATGAHDPAWEEAARQLPPTQTTQEKSNPTHGGSISMLGGGQKNLHDNWNTWDENWVQNKMATGLGVQQVDRSQH